MVTKVQFWVMGTRVSKGQLIENRERVRERRFGYDVKSTGPEDGDNRSLHARPLVRYPVVCTTNGGQDCYSPLACKSGSIIVRLRSPSFGQIFWSLGRTWLSFRFRGRKSAKTAQQAMSAIVPDSSFGTSKVSAGGPCGSSLTAH